MNNDLDFESWAVRVASVFWANGCLWDVSPDTLLFLYQDDATPEEVFEEAMRANGY